MLTVAILAGGRATRLGSLAQHLPKSLLSVNGEPFLVHQLRLLRANGVTNVVLCLGHLGEMIQQAIGDGSTLGIQVDYSFDGPNLLGTAGAVRKALPRLGESFFVMYGDSYLPCNYPRIARDFATKHVLGMMTVFRNNGRWDASNVEYESGRILAYSKTNRTPQMKHIDYGLGLFRAGAFETVPQHAPSDLADVYAALLKRNQLAAFQIHQRFYEIGSPSGLRETSDFLASRASPPK